MKQVSNLILDTLERTNKDWTPKAHYPSSAGFEYSDGEIIGPDMLSQFYKWTGVKPSNPSNGESIMKMRLGDGTHEVIAKILSSSGIKVMSEVSFKQAIPGLKHPISGRVDNLLELEPGELEVLEVKSSSDDQMFGGGWMRGKGIIDKGPKPDHVAQVICYLNNVPGLKRGRFLYVARDTGRMIEFILTKVPGQDSYLVDEKPVREISWAGIVKRWTALEAAVASGVVPAPSYRAWLNDAGEVMPVKQIKGEKFKTPWRVNFDSYRDLIWKNPDNFKYSYNAMGVEYARKDMQWL